jgi:hypothetical protein
MPRKRKSKTSSPNKRTRSGKDIYYAPIQYEGSKIVKYLLRTTSDLNTSDTNLRPYRFIRNIANAVCIFQSITKPESSEQISAVESSDSADIYTVRDLTQEIATRVDMTTGININKKFWERLVKKSTMSDEDTETIVSMLESCFFIYPFYSEHTISDEFDSVLHMLGGWYKEYEPTPTLIVFITRNTFNIIVWKAVYDTQNQSVSLYELATDEELEQYVSEEVSGLTLEEVSKVRVWKHVIKNPEGGAGYDFEQDESGQVKYYTFDMKEA